MSVDWLNRKYSPKTIKINVWNKKNSNKIGLSASKVNLDQTAPQKPSLHTLIEDQFAKHDLSEKILQKVNWRFCEKECPVREGATFLGLYCGGIVATIAGLVTGGPGALGGLAAVPAGAAYATLLLRIPKMKARTRLSPEELRVTVREYDTFPELTAQQKNRATFKNLENKNKANYYQFYFPIGKLSNLVIGTKNAELAKQVLQEAGSVVGISKAQAESLLSQSQEATRPKSTLKSAQPSSFLDKIRVAVSGQSMLKAGSS